MGLLNKIFGKISETVQSATSYKLLNDYTSEFTNYDGNAWEISLVRSAISAFARNAAKVSPKHIVRTGEQYKFTNSQIERVLSVRPNEFMSAYAFWYKIAAMYKLDNNAFIYPVWDGEKLTAVYPIMAKKVSLFEYKGKMYVQFEFNKGRTNIIPYDEVVHLRNYFYDSDVFGSSNKALTPVLQTAHRFNESMSKFAELVSVIRGILKVQTAVKDSDLKAQRDKFVENNLTNSQNGSGVIITDGKYDYTPIADKATPIPDGQLKFIKDQIYDYFGVNEEIIQNKFSENSWAAYYEGELEPFFIQLSQALTNALFTARERGCGNEIICEANRLQYTSAQTKVSVVTCLSNVGAITLDQICEIFNLAPVGGEDGKRRVQTLNMVNSTLADQYQLGNKNNDGKGEEQDANVT